jgi:hypothetical protein
VAKDAATDRLAAVEIRARKVGIQRDLVNAAAESTVQETPQIGVALGLCRRS